MTYTEEQKREAMKIICTIYAYFDAPIDALFVRRGDEKIVNARFFSYYVLHKLANCPNTFISEVFKKSTRNIRRGYAKIAWGIENQHYYSARYAGLLSVIGNVPRIFTTGGTH